MGLCLVLGAGGLLVPVASPAAQPGSNIEELFRRTLGFSTGQIRTLQKGVAVIRSLDTPVRQEVAHVGVVYIAAPAERFVERFRDIEPFERGPGIPQIGRFASPPTLGDLRPLTLPPADIASLRTCRPGDCGMKLSAAAMGRFQDEVRWESATAVEEAGAVYRGVLLDLLRAYQTQGNGALGRYEDAREPLDVAEEFQALLASRDPLPTPVPGLLRYLDEYPRGRPAGAEEFFYWTVVEFGLKQTVRLNHVVIYPLDPATASGVAYAIAIKQLYASHYFHTTLELRFLVVDESRGSPGSWLISITRSRNDGMTGFTGLFVGPIVNRRSRDGVRGYLEYVKRQVERPAGPGR